MPLRIPASDAPRLTPRLRALADEPNFSILLLEDSGRVTFGYVRERLEALAPLTDEEKNGLREQVQRWIDLQLRRGQPSNLVGVDGLFGILGVSDLPLEEGTLALLQTWLERVSLADLLAMRAGYTVRAERNGNVFDSPWHQDFIPNWIPDGVERALDVHAAGYLRAKNPWVQEHGVEDSDLRFLIDARETLLCLARGSLPGRRKSIPQSVTALLALLEKKKPGSAPRR